MLLMCYSFLNSLNGSTNNSEKRLVTRAPPTYLKQLQKLHIKQRNNWPMLSFNHIWSDITTWMGYSFKTKIQKHKIKSNILKIRTSFFESQVADSWISTRTLELCANSPKQLFLYLHLWKNIFSSSFYHSVSVYQSVSVDCLESYGFSAKVLPAWWRYKRGFSFFFPYIR